MVLDYTLPADPGFLDLAILMGQIPFILFSPFISFPLLCLKIADSERPGRKKKNSILYDFDFFPPILYL